MGLVGIDLLGPSDFPTIKKHGLICTMTGSHPLSNGLADPKYWDASLKAINTAIEAMSKEGWRNVICFSGNRRGIDDRTGMNNCLKALKEIVPVAEKANVILNMELLNSKVDHHDYMCDRSPWGVELVKRVGSDNFKLLYDIYHMQIMEGDVIRTIRQNHDRLRPLPHRRQPRPQRARRHPGAELQGDRPRHRRHRLPGLHGPRVHPPARPADEPGRSRRAVCGLKYPRVCRPRCRETAPDRGDPRGTACLVPITARLNFLHWDRVGQDDAATPSLPGSVRAGASSGAR